MIIQDRSPVPLDFSEVRVYFPHISDQSLKVFDAVLVDELAELLLLVRVCEGHEVRSDDAAIHDGEEFVTGGDIETFTAASQFFLDLLFSEDHIG